MGWVGLGRVPGGYAALVGQVSGDASLVPLLGSADEGRVEDESILGRVALGLQGSEEGLLCSQNLHCGCWIFGQICQGACNQIGQLGDATAGVVCAMLSKCSGMQQGYLQCAAHQSFSTTQY